MINSTSFVGPRRMSERDLPSRVSAEGSVKSILPSSKSVPALHHGGSSMQEMLVYYEGCFLTNILVLGSVTSPYIFFYLNVNIVNIYFLHN